MWHLLTGSTPASPLRESVWGTLSKASISKFHFPPGNLFMTLPGASSMPAICTVPPSAYNQPEKLVPCVMPHFFCRFLWCFVFAILATGGPKGRAVTV